MSVSGLPDIRPFLISGSDSGSGAGGKLPDSLLIYCSELTCCFAIFHTFTVSQH